MGHCRANENTRQLLAFRKLNAGANRNTWIRDVRNISVRNVQKMWLLIKVMSNGTFIIAAKNTFIITVPSLAVNAAIKVILCSFWSSAQNVLPRNDMIKTLNEELSVDPVSGSINKQRSAQLNNVFILLCWITFLQIKLISYFILV